MHYLNRYECYINILANLQGNHPKFARKDLKDIEIINYLSSVYYYNGIFLGKCNFNDNINVLKPVAIGKGNESYEYTNDLNEMLELSEHSKSPISIKVKVGDLLFPLTALYKTTAKQFKIFANASIDINKKRIDINMKPFKKSTSVKESFSEIPISSINLIDDIGVNFDFNFNVAMVVDILKFYKENEFIVIKLFTDDDGKFINSFNIYSYNKIKDNLIWTFKSMPFEDMYEYLRKNKS